MQYLTTNIRRSIRKLLFIPCISTLGLIWVGVNIFWLKNISNLKNHKWAKEKFYALGIKIVKIKFNENIIKINFKTIAF